MNRLLSTRRRLLGMTLALVTVAFIARAPVFADTAKPTTAPAVAGQQVFVAGHSFHFFIGKWLEEIVPSTDIKGHKTLGVTFIGGSRVIQHWNVPDEKNKTKAALNTGTVDVLTLSPITLPDEGIEKFAKLALEKNPNVRVTVQQSWLPNDEPFEKAFPLHNKKELNRDAATAAELQAMYDAYAKRLDDNIVAVNKTLDKPVLLVVPCGEAMLMLREKVRTGEAPGIKKQSELFMDALGHPTAPGQVLVAYCHFAVIYRRSPVGLPVPPTLARMGFADEKLNRLLQEIAWDAVIHEPLSGVSASGPATRP